jgi:WXG100 family type VII secretion target
VRPVSDFDVTPVELQVCGSMLADLSQEIHAKMRVLKDEVDALRSGGWQGKAANGFSQGWDQWQAGANDILDALKTMGHLLGTTGRDYALADETSAGNVTQSGIDL